MLRLLYISFFVLALSFSSVGQKQFYNARFEPKDQVIHGAGQSHQEFKNYVSVLHPSTKPIIYMAYTGLNNPRIVTSIQKVNASLKEFDWFLIPQFGLSMTRDGEPEKHYEHLVAAGEFDSRIDSMVIALKEMKRPVFLRIGYEFNGSWNGYNPETYREAYRRIKVRLDLLKASNVATVWCFGATEEAKSYMEYYPGDEYVDWWGIDLFKPEEFELAITNQFLVDAQQHHKPVMIGESTPRNVGVLKGEASWNTWFKPYFNLINNNAHIKAFCYISWNWAEFPQWADWGDGRIGSNEFVRRKYQKELKSKKIIHGASEKTTNKILRYEE